MTQLQLAIQNQKADVSAAKTVAKVQPAVDGKKVDELSAIVRLIVEDASCDPLRYLLRSNTSHDGE